MGALVPDLEVCLVLYGPFYTDIPRVLGLSENVDGAQTHHRWGSFFK